MTDIASVRRKVQIEETDFRSAVSESLLQKMGAVVNFLIDNSTFQVGDVVQSVLDEATFQSLRDTNWVLCDGRSVVGTDYQSITLNSNIPDLRGKFPRMKDNGAGIDPAGDLPIGTYQVDQIGQHRHPLGASAQLLSERSPFSGSNGYIVGADSSNVSGNYNNSTADFGAAIDQNLFNGYTEFAGFAENRPKAVIFNYFIKINN